AAAAYRQRKAPSGTKTDYLDAWSLADALRMDGQGWKSLQPMDELSCQLTELGGFGNWLSTNMTRLRRSSGSPCGLFNKANRVKKFAPPSPGHSPQKRLSAVGNKPVATSEAPTVGSASYFYKDHEKTDIGLGISLLRNP